MFQIQIIRSRKNKVKIAKPKISAQNKNSASEEIDQDQAAKDDEEPKRDKQHWRVKKIPSGNTF